MRAVMSELRRNLSGRTALTLVGWVVYVLALVPLTRQLGPVAIAFGVVPVVATGWFFGTWAGLLASLLVLPLNAVLVITAGEVGWVAVMVRGLPGYLVSALLAVGAGRLHDLTERIKQESAERKGAEEELKSLARFPSENRNPVLRVAGGGTILYANEASAPLLDLWATQVDGKLPERWQQIAASALDEGGVQISEVGCGDRIFSLDFAPVKEEGYANVYGRDVTERKQAEEMLSREAEVNTAMAELSNTLLSSAPLEEISYLVLQYARGFTDSRFGFVGYIDPQTGYLVAPTMTRDVWDSCQVEDKDIVLKKFGGLLGWVLDHRRPLITNSPSDDPRSSGTPEGHIPITRFLSAPALIGDTLVGTVGLANAERDYTEQDLEVVQRLATLYAVAVQRQRAEREIEERRTYLERLVGAIPDAVVALDARARIVEWNPGAEKLFGYSWEEVKGQGVDGLIAAGDILDEARGFTRSITGGEDLSPTETIRYRKDGSPVAVTVAGSAIMVGEELIGAVGVYTDITERKEAEEQLKRYAAELEQANEEVKQFAYIVSHDLRAPLVNLKGFSAELRADLAVAGSALIETLPHLDERRRKTVSLALEEDIPESLAFIEASVTRMDHFINAVLRLSRLGRRELRFEPVDMNALVQVALQTLAHQIDEHQTQVSVGALPEVVADRISMEQIMGNILGNAVKYLESGRSGELEITGEQGPDGTTFQVRDNGRGIAERDMERVFAPFRRAGRQDVAGEGMGLAYVQTLVRRHGGRIWCESELGVGTTFVFTIADRV